MNVPLALGPHRMGIAGKARLLRYPWALRAGLGQHRDPPEQQIRGFEPLARAYESPHRRPDARQESLAEQGVAHRLMDHADTARTVVVRDPLFADEPARPRRVMVAQ